MSKKFTVILDEEEADLLKKLAVIFEGLANSVSNEKAEEPIEEAPTTRRRRANADAASSTTEPASDAGASVGRRSRRTSVEPEPAPAAEEPAPRRSRRTAEPEPAPAAEEPVRRRRAPAVEDGISDADVTKAASQAAAKITPKVVMDILKEDFGVDSANDLPQAKRQAFLDELKFQMEG